MPDASTQTDPAAPTPVLSGFEYAYQLLRAYRGLTIEHMRTQQAFRLATAELREYVAEHAGAGGGGQRRVVLARAAEVEAEASRRRVVYGRWEKALREEWRTAWKMVWREWSAGKDAEWVGDMIGAGLLDDIDALPFN